MYGYTDAVPRYRQGYTHNIHSDIPTWHRDQVHHYAPTAICTALAHIPHQVWVQERVTRYEIERESATHCNTPQHTATHPYPTRYERERESVQVILMHMCICIYIFVCGREYIYTYIYTYTDVWIYRCVDKCVYTYILICMGVRYGGEMCIYACWFW